MKEVVPISCHRMPSGEVKAIWGVTTDVIEATYIWDDRRKKYFLGECAANWATLKKPTNDPRTWFLLHDEKLKKERIFIQSQAVSVLDCLNIPFGTDQSLKKIFKGAVLGFEEYSLTDKRNWTNKTNRGEVKK